MKKIGMLLIILSSFIIFGKNNFKFDENRIKKVFIEYELINSKSEENIYLHFCDRNNEIRIEISNYKKGGTETGEKRDLKMFQ